MSSRGLVARQSSFGGAEPTRHDHDRRLCLSDQRRKPHFAKLHFAVVTLEHNRASFVLIGVQCAARYTRHFTVVNDLGSVQDHRHAVGNKGYLISLPLARGLVGIHGGNDKSIQSPLAMDVERTAIAVKHLDFITAAEIDTAIALGVYVELDFELEIVELLASIDVVRCLILVHQDAVFDEPAQWAARILAQPPGQILAIEQVDRFTRLSARWIRWPDRPSDTRPGKHLAIGRRRSDQACTLHSGSPDLLSYIRRAAPWVLESQLASFDGNLRQVENRPAASIESPLKDSLVAPQLQPAESGLSCFGARRGNIPSAQEKIRICRVLT